MKKCFFYPGQGAQYPGMGKDLWDYSSKVKELFKTASDAASMNLEKLLFEGSEDELKITENTQAAVTLVNVAAALVLKEKGFESDLCAGFSLGEITALWDAGVIETESLFALVKQRGAIMEKVSRSLDTPSGSPGMAAVIGLDYPAILNAIKSENIADVFAANYNSPSQIVISGTQSGLSKAEEVFKKAGAKRFIKLKVSGPFHCPLMSDAEIQYCEVLAKFNFKNPVKKVFSNVTGNLISTGDEAKKLCSQQLTSVVLWADEEKKAAAEKPDVCIESGPGTVLTGLWKQIENTIQCFPAGTIENILKIE